MSVFTRFFRRAKGQDGAPAADPAPVAPAAAEGGDQSVGTTTEDVPAGERQPGPPDAAGAGTASAPESGAPVEIPQQQSAGRAADNEAGEGARA
ncbi:hypothetical protein ACSMX9_23410 [Streptomyces sp. LE64]|uniref:hypothetical protein n=1 Tax=Streptomyces sp. LE64 TaxID=3448653 RepID=UPI00404312B3